MRILTVLTYFSPHWTGLTVIARSLAIGLAARGHDVTVLTGRHDDSLPLEDHDEGARIVRLPAVARLSRGLILPSFPLRAWQLIGEHDVVHIHTPLMEGPVVGAFCRLRGRPLVMTHQGDLVMPAGLGNQVVQRIGNVVMAATGRLATEITTHNADYAENSPCLRGYPGKVAAIYPPVVIPAPDPGEVARRRHELGLADAAVVGFAGRFVEEKGFDFLLRALPELAERVPNVHLVFAGEHEMTYENFYERCRPLVEQQRERITFVGLLRDRQELADFYSMCDVLAVPSRTDCLALVQLEAMLCGTPVVASDIVGGRTAVSASGMGLLVQPRDPASLAGGLATVLEDPLRYTRPREEISQVFDASRSIDAYEQLFERLLRARR